MYHSKRGGEKYQEWIVVEQVFDQLKDDLGLGELPWHVRGVREVREQVDRALFALLVPAPLGSGNALLQQNAEERLEESQALSRLEEVCWKV